MNVVDARSISKTFERGGQQVHALRSVDLVANEGDFVVLRGRSGSGKTTLLNIIGGLERCDSGSLAVCGTDLVAASDSDLGVVRREHVAFVFQNFGLLDVLTAAENVGVPLRLRGVNPSERRERVDDLLERVGLGHRRDHRPDELSGGEQQRVAIARALAVSPTLLVADEPTGQLDERTGAAVFELLRHVTSEANITAIISTHDRHAVAAADVVIHLHDGAVADGPG